MIERLTAEDALMLWPDAIWPQDIGALILLDGATLYDEHRCLRLEAVRQAVAARLHHVPQFRQILYVPPPRLGGPLWVDAPAFHLAEHIGVDELPAPGDEAQLLLAVEKARRRRLDRSRPLWEMRFFTGLDDGRLALFVRMHHAIADGMAGVATMATFLDATPDAVPTPPEQWIPLPMPTEAELRDDERRRRRRRRLDGLSRLAHPIQTMRPMAAAWPATAELLAQRPLPPTSLTRLVGPTRALALVRSRLGPVKQVAHRYGATVNDVFLAVIAGGLRGLLSSRGERVEGALRIYVPISLHQRRGAETRGNLISQMVVPLPMGNRDPVSSLWQIAAETALRKAKSRPSLGWLPVRGVAGWAFLKLVGRQRVNVTSANVPGPQMPLYLAGARLLEVFPLTQLIGKVSLGVAAISYAGQFDMLAVADGDAYPDLDVFANSAENELHALTTAAGVSAPSVKASPGPPAGPRAGG